MDAVTAYPRRYCKNNACARSEQYKNKYIAKRAKNKNITRLRQVKKTEKVGTNTEILHGTNVQ